MGYIACGTGQTQHKVQHGRRVATHGGQRQLGTPDIAIPALGDGCCMLKGICRLRVKRQGLSLRQSRQALHAQLYAVAIRLGTEAGLRFR